MLRRSIVPFPFAGSPYREVAPPAPFAEARAAPFAGVEAMAWLVACAASLVRALFGLVDPQLDPRDTWLACWSCALVLIAFAFRSEP